MVFGGISACGQSDDAYLSIKVISAASQDQADTSDGLRLFGDPENPPERIKVLVVKTSDPENGRVAEVDKAWDDLSSDPNSSGRFLLIGIPPNDGTGDPYMLRLSSLVSTSGTMAVDECGVIGEITAPKGAKVRVTIATHVGNCNWFCKDDDGCLNNNYCLGFECQPQPDAPCTDDGHCMEGAYCTNESLCNATCQDAGDCRDNYLCCGKICSPSCGL